MSPQRSQLLSAPKTRVTEGEVQRPWKRFGRDRIQIESFCRLVKEPVSKEEAAKQEKLRLQAAAYAAKRDMGLTGDPSKRPLTSHLPCHAFIMTV